MSSDNAEFTPAFDLPLWVADVTYLFDERTVAHNPKAAVKHHVTNYGRYIIGGKEQIRTARKRLSDDVIMYIRAIIANGEHLGSDRLTVATILDAYDSRPDADDFAKIKTELKTCQGELETCQGDFAKIKAELETSQGEFAKIKAELKTCQDELAMSQCTATIVGAMYRDLSARTGSGSITKEHVDILDTTENPSSCDNDYNYEKDLNG